MTNPFLPSVHNYRKEAKARTVTLFETYDDLECDGNLPEYFDDSFVESLREQFQRKGFLTERQMEALENIVERWTP